MQGATGNDLLVGGKGNDKMRGGTGADEFKFARGMDRDTIGDFKIGTDKLLLKKSLVGGVLSDEKLAEEFITIKGKAMILKFGKGDVLKLTGVIKKGVDPVDLAGDVDFF